MTSLAEEMPKAIERAQKVRDEFISLRGMPNVMVEPQIAIITHQINQAVQALASGDVIAIMRAYESIKDYEA